MIQDISKKIARLKANPKILKGIFRGIERETLRIQKNGNFSEKRHPYSIGSPLTHKWITTDFSENLLEFVTPKSNNIDYLLSFLKDLHCFTASKIKNERMWPFSIPYCYNNKTNIQIAQYGKSNSGKIKTIYRKGLKSRYGDVIHTVSGVHYNFSLPLTFWEHNKEKQDQSKNIDYISSGYFNLIRNYYRFGWIIPYLFGASPAVSSCLLTNQHKKYTFQKNQESIFYLPWSTSLRLSNIRKINTQITDLNIMFEDLHSYVESFTKAIKTPSKKFINIGLKDIEGNFKQLNTNILQMENELYTQIRPKRQINHGESLIEALKKRGVEYVEIRSLDINPFSPIGINKNQILFLDLFLIWCALIDSQQINKKDFLLITKNWEKIIFEGRKPNQTIYINDEYKTKTLIEISDIIFKDLHEIALILDCHSGNYLYQNACKKIKSFFNNPELTYSAKFLKYFMKKDIKQTGLNLSHKYHKDFTNKNYLNMHQKMLDEETIRSHMQQRKIEKDDILSFEEYIN